MNESDHKRIVLILGNGFDLDRGLKTSYKDFWESDYCPKDYPAPLIKHLNQRWQNKLDAVKWYDLENELFNYYKGLRDKEVGDDFLTKQEIALLKEFDEYSFRCGRYSNRLYLVKSLIEKGVLSYNDKPVVQVGKHYKDEALQSPVCRDQKALGLIKQGLCKYLKSLGDQVDDSNTAACAVLFAISYAYKRGEIVNIYTFNFTPVPKINIRLSNRFIHYLHGDCSTDKIIIGTRDDLSISTSYDFMQKSFDPNYNPPALVDDLFEADEVIIFGHSLGVNDRQYFMPYFKQQSAFGPATRKNITIFTYDEAAVVETKRSLQQMTDGNLSTLFGRNNLKIIKTADLLADQSDFKDFLTRFIKNVDRVEEVLGKLLPI